MTKKWEGIKNRVLGKRFDLSIVFAGDRLMEELNAKYRKKRKVADVLAFKLSDSCGEILIRNNLRGRKEALRLFIHALLHLKGHSHSDKMENEEKKLWREIS